jgi:riboflavin synthase
VIEKGDRWFAVEVSGETLSKTTLDAWRNGTRINLERAAKLGDELGGHIVSGHVDGVGEVVSVAAEGGSHRVSIRAPRPLHRFIAPKGSITVEGVSLTVNEVEDDVFGVNLIPHTWDVTTLGELKPGSKVNLEIDMLARYLARFLETQA